MVTYYVLNIEVITLLQNSDEKLQNALISLPIFFGMQHFCNL
jgi:hypothetical protein